MANGSTTNLALIKPENNADADNWGLHWNTNADTLDAILGGDIFGLTLSTAGSSSTFGIAAGGASGMALASAYTKTTSAWAVGTASGALDTGSIANSTWYHVWLIQRVDTSVVDVLVSLSATSPTMPSNYTRKRRIGAMKTDGSAHWTKFVQLGDTFLWDAPTVDQNAASLSATASLYAVSVPSGVQVDAILTVGGSGGASGTFNYLQISSPDQGTIVAATLGLAVCSWQVGVTVQAAQAIVRTNTSSQILANAAVGSSLFYAGTRGWVDPRGRF